MMTSSELKFGYEFVFTVTNYYDGPRQGLASFNGRPHFYDCIFESSHDEYSDLYRLTPVSQTTLDAALEDWAIWQRWEMAFHTGRATVETHPALSEDRARHEELKAILEVALMSSDTDHVLRTGSFVPLGKSDAPRGVLRPLQVMWSEPRM